MNFWICSVFIAVLSLQFSVSLCTPDSSCPDFTATFVAMADQTIDDTELLINDAEQTFFRDTLGFRDTDIQNAAADALRFFNETYGLDFSHIPLNEQHQHVLGNASLRQFRFPEHVHYQHITTGFKLGALVSHVGILKLEGFLSPSQETSSFMAAMEGWMEYELE